MLTQIARLRRVRQVPLPEGLFADVSPHLVQAYRQRAAAEPLRAPVASLWQRLRDFS